ncbi:MAG: phosphatidylserine decarboxylase family protein [Syntrophales bacterium]
MSKEDQHSRYIVEEGLPFIFSSFLVAILIYWAGFRFVSLLFFCLAFFVTWFFRNPERKTPEKEGLIISPADGLVLKIEEAQCAEAPGQTLRKVSIFMNVFNVHVNRFPCSGEVRTIRYKPGKFFSANLDKASELNERNTVVIRRADGCEIVAVQIAGLIARRIVCWSKERETAQKGKRFGMIRFGSRLEVFMPLSSVVLVNIGEKVRAGETPIGELI